MLRRGFAPDDAGVVDENVDLPERGDAVGEQLVGSGAIREVGGEQFRAASVLFADAIGGLRGRLLVAVQCHGCACCGEGGRRRGAEPARSAGHQRHFPVERKGLERHAPSPCPQKVFTRRREDVDQLDLFLEHGRAVLNAGWKQQHIAGLRGPLLSFDEEVGSPSLDQGHLLVDVRMNRRHGSRGERQTAHHQPIAGEHLARDSLGNGFDRDGGPVEMLKYGQRIRRRHFFLFFSERPLSRPEPRAANSG